MLGRTEGVEDGWSVCVSMCVCVGVGGWGASGRRGGETNLRQAGGGAPEMDLIEL